MIQDIHVNFVDDGSGLPCDLQSGRTSREVDIFARVNRREVPGQPIFAELLSAIWRLRAQCSLHYRIARIEAVVPVVNLVRLAAVRVREAVGPPVVCDTVCQSRLRKDSVVVLVLRQRVGSDIV